MKLTGLISLFVICFIGCNSANEEFTIKQITNKLPEEVVEILGEPDSAYFQTVVTKRFFTQRYNQLEGKYDVEIQYLSGRSNDIIITDIIDDHPYDEKVLVNFGLPEAPPTETLPNGYFKWKGFEGFHVVNVYSTHLDDSGVADDFKIFFKYKDTL
jgi:hypothetical protein